MFQYLVIFGQCARYLYTFCFIFLSLPVIIMKLTCNSMTPPLRFYHLLYVNSNPKLMPIPGTFSLVYHPEQEEMNKKS